MKSRTWADLPLVEIVWDDAAIDTGQEADLADPDSIRKFGGKVRCRDVGYLVSKDRTEVRLAVGVIEPGAIRHSNTIPRGWVRDIIYLSRPPEPPSELPNAD